MNLKRDYRVPARLLANTEPEQQPYEVISEIHKAWCVCPDSQRTEFLTRLTPGQRAFLAFVGFEGEVYNGGIHQYFYNSTGDFYEEVRRGLLLIQAKRQAALFDKALALFPDDETRRDRALRQKVLKKITPEETEALFDDPFQDQNEKPRAGMAPLRLAYLRKHPEEFVLPAGQAEEKEAIADAATPDYRASRSKGSTLRGEPLHWALIESLWDDYWTVLKAGRPETLALLSRLPAGLRALIAIDILNKVVTNMNGLSDFLGTSAGADVLVEEVRTGYQLLCATPYSEWFERVLQVSGDLPALHRLWSDADRRAQEAKKAGTSAELSQAKKVRVERFQALQEKKRSLRAPLEALTDELPVLLENPKTAIEPYIERYVDAHADEFFRD